MRDLLVFQSGSLAQVKQVRYINNINATTWNDQLAEPYMVRKTVLKEFSLFIKDDWKIRPDLTLNLGVRWDYYGVPYLANGMTVGLAGGGSSIFGPSGGYENWFAPINRGDTASGDLVSIKSIGPNSANPGERLFPKTWTNIGPAVGFAYELPWFGKGKTTIRGGFQRSYVSMAGNFQSVESVAGASPGFFNINTWNNGGTWAANDYFGIKDLAANPIFANGIPVASSVTPGLTAFPLYDRKQSISAYASDYGYPMVNNLTFAVTRNMTSNLAVDLRYIGTLQRRGFSSRDLNAPNFLTNGLLEAFDAARAGQDPVLLDQLLNGVAPLPWGCVVDGATCKGGAALRAAAFPNFNTFSGPGAFTNLNTLLATGNYQGLANMINVLNKPGDPNIGKFMVDNGFPVNFIKASPQFNNATLYENLAYDNYHSFQAQITLRPTNGLSFQSTYTWSKNLGNSGGVSPDPRDLSTGYTLQGSDRPHNWVTFGTIDLPFGPGKLLGKDTHGVLGRVIGGWQMGWITNITSGAPLALTANCGLYGNCAPDAVNGGIDPKSAEVTWIGDHGTLFADRYTFVPDPQCDSIEASLQPLCRGSLSAIVDSRTGNIVMQNPLPGNMGTAGYNKFRNYTRWNVDMSMSKSVAIDETKSFRLRVDISNMFNHPISSSQPTAAGRVAVPTAPSMSINGGTPIGQYTYKVGGRTIQAMARFDF
jgi:hypothetical protein